MYKLVKAAGVISDETRLRMLNLLLERECCVCEVMQILAISLTRASRNLNMLYDAGFLKLRRKGRWAHYSLDRDNLDQYLSYLVKAVEIGLNGNKTALQDRERLKKSERLSPERLSSECCASSVKTENQMSEAEIS
jgi:ArsR family transcriptional regulator, arsenate/arsenite/antimonite-responsive transcriptional repressor